MRLPFDDLQSAERRMSLLAACAAEQGLPLNFEDARRSDHPDVKWLLRKGYIALRRTRLGARCSMTRAHATPAGMAAHARGRF